MTLARTFKHSANSWAPPALKPFHNHASMKRWMPSTERRKQHRHADNHSHRRSWQRCRTSIHATRRSGLLVQCRRKPRRSEEHTSELQSLMRISYAVFCLKKKNNNNTMNTHNNNKNT